MCIEPDEDLIQPGALVILQPTTIAQFTRDREDTGQPGRVFSFRAHNKTKKHDCDPSASFEQRLLTFSHLVPILNQIDARHG